MGARIEVAAGEVYRVPRRGLPARHVRIVRVVRGQGFFQPTASYVEVSRSGRRKAGGPIRTFLQWRDGAWRLGPGFELVEELGTGRGRAARRESEARP